MSVTVKLRDVRMVYPHLGAPDKWGLYSVGVLIKKGSPSYTRFVDKLREAWAEAGDRFGKASFEANPTESRLFRAAYVKVGGGEDAKGRPLPEWMRDYIQFGAQQTDPTPVVDANLEPVMASDTEVCYTGQNCHISLDLCGFSNPESHNTGISRYLRSVVVLGGGERIATRAGGFTDIVDEWGEED